MFRLTRPSSDELERLLATVKQAKYSYAAAGATLEAGSLPAGYRHDESVSVLTGPDAFDRSCRGLRTWQAHLGARATIYPGGPVEPDQTVLVLMGVGPLHVIGFCRVVRVIDEPDRFGFAYGTLPGHPEEGEEAFVVERVGPDVARFRIRAFSKPADPLVKAAAPVARRVQISMTRRYERAMQRWVAQDPH